MANIVIFGGQGYLGQNLICQCGTDHKFMTIGRSSDCVQSGIEYTHVSISDSALFEKLNLFQPDYFLISYYGNPMIQDVNVYDRLNNNIWSIYESINSRPKIVFLSSQLVFGEDEVYYNKIINPSDFYGQMCIEFERQIQVKTPGRYLIVRVPVVYGGVPSLKNGYKNIISVFINLAKNGKELMVFGNGSQTRSIIHMEDFVTFINNLLTRPTSIEIINASFDEHYSIRELASLISKEFKVPCILDREWPVNKSPEKLYDIRLDPSAAQSLVSHKWDLKKYLKVISE